MMNLDIENQNTNDLKGNINLSENVPSNYVQP